MGRGVPPPDIRKEPGAVKPAGAMTGALALIYIDQTAVMTAIPPRSSLKVRPSVASATSSARSTTKV